jgi:hypothetical protein
VHKALGKRVQTSRIDACARASTSRAALGKGKLLVKGHRRHADDDLLAVEEAQAREQEWKPIGE